MGSFAVELITTVVTSPGGTVKGGTETINVGGQLLNAVVQSGQATALVLLPLPLAAMPQSISLLFTPSNFDFAVSSVEELALLTILNAQNPGFVLFGENGSEIVVGTVIDGVPIGLTYNAHGQFTGFAFGILPSP